MGCFVFLDFAIYNFLQLYPQALIRKISRREDYGRCMTSQMYLATYFIRGIALVREQTPEQEVIFACLSECPLAWEGSFSKWYFSELTDTLVDWRSLRMTFCLTSNDYTHIISWCFFILKISTHNKGWNDFLVFVYSKVFNILRFDRRPNTTVYKIHNNYTYSKMLSLPNVQTYFGELNHFPAFQ